MALNKHMAAAVAEIQCDIAQLEKERLKARTCRAAAGLKLDIKNLKAAARTIDSLYGGDDPVVTEPLPTTIKGHVALLKKDLRVAQERRYVYGGHALAVAATLPEPLTAIDLSLATGFTRAAASKCLKRWAADGWVRKKRHGEYVRTAKFPATVIPAE